MWIADFVKLYEDDRPLPKREVLAVAHSLPGGSVVRLVRSGARQHHSGPPLPSTPTSCGNEGLLDVAVRASHSVGTVAVLRSVRGSPVSAARERRAALSSARRQPSGRSTSTAIRASCELDPRWHQAALRFVKDGFFHILDGIDHLLFLLGLVIPFRRLRSLIVVVTSFTIAHSVTLIASAYDLAPKRAVVSAAGRAVDRGVDRLHGVREHHRARLRRADGRLGRTNRRALERRWAVAFGFGLIHGFGFSFALRETLQFAGSHLLTSLLSFNVGVELGQLLVLVILVPLLNLLFRFVVDERIGTHHSLRACRAHRLALGDRSWRTR